MKSNIFAYYKSLQSIYLGEQISLFIALYVFVLLWDSSLRRLFFLFTAKLKSMVKGKWNIFLQFLMVDALS